MTSGAPDPYLPPAAKLDGPSAGGGGGAASDGGVQARIAGGFIAVNATMRTASTAWRIFAGRELTLVSLVAVLIAPIAILIVDWSLAVPLLRGSVRFRILTWIRAGLGVVLPLLLTLLSISASKARAPERVERLWTTLERLPWTTGLFALAIVSLVTRGPSRWRLVTGLIAIAAYVVVWFR